MYYIFVSSKDNSLKPLEHIGEDALRYCIPPDNKIVDSFRKQFSRKRFIDCYSMYNKLDGNLSVSEEELKLWHGYLLEKKTKSWDSLKPEISYYGVYSHGCISSENCWFTTDEIGLSPLYYSLEGGDIFVSNNPHLIAMYKRKLGFTIKVEPTLAVWHTVGITNESNNTGYENIFRVLPWRYVTIDYNNNISFPSKKRIDKQISYDELCHESIRQLKEGMHTINSKFIHKFSQLTGGFDSRLTMSFIMDNGHIPEWTFITKGREDNPDCIIAKLLAEKFHLNHNCTPRKLFNEEVENPEDFIKEVCKANAMESSLVRLNTFMGNQKDDVCLNGMGAAFAKSFGFADAFQINMKRKFRGKEIDFNKLDDSEYAVGYDCFGHADADRYFLNEEGLNVVRNFRKYLFEFNYNRFPENLNYADSMSAYRWRIHNCNLASIENNLIFLYAPVVLEASRRLQFDLRRDGKLYFDIMWRINPELCFIPYENRVYNPKIYEEYPQQIKEIFKSIPPIEGNIVSEAQTSFFDTMLPKMRENLIDRLPTEVFDYIKKDSIEERLKENYGFGKPVFALIGLYGIAKWYEIVKELNEKF